MNILFISYGNYQYDGRQRELIKICKKIGDTTYITCTNNDYIPTENNHLCFRNKGRFAYISFVRFVFKTFRQSGKFNMIFVDNRKATIPALLIKKRCKDAIVVQDARELYLKSEVKSISSKLGCYFETKMYNKANVIICANEFRADKMMKEFKLKTLPLVYENLRQLEYSENADLESYEKKMSQWLDKDAINIISTSGCSYQRTNDRLVKAVAKLDVKCNLFLVGGSTEEEKALINNLIEKYKLNNIYIIDMLNQNELKFLISKCHIGIVNYGNYDTNNLYCASGKIYEFIFEGKPVVTTNNPPLKSFCNKYQVGVSGDDYYKSLIEVIDNYDMYCENVRKVKDIINIEENNNNLVDSLKKLIMCD